MMPKTVLPDCCKAALQEQMRPELFKALCDPVRISITATLASQSASSTVTEIADCCGIDFSGVSRHLKILKDAGVLVAERSGRSVLYRLDMPTVTSSLRGIADALEVCQSGVAA
jgi:ArsR family transcriptional regulator